MPRLTKQEQQEILRCLETDKPLPDNFRFLLFEEKREVEKNQVVSHDVAASEVKPLFQHPPVKGGKGGSPSQGNKGQYISYNPALTEKARELRKNQTPAESKLWFDILQNKRLADLKFTRQKPLGEFIVDFYCAEIMLAIEIDGDSHAEQIDYDEQRTLQLNRLGVDVIRYSNSDVLENIDGVYVNLLEKIEERRKKPPKSPLSGGLAR